MRQRKLGITRGRRRQALNGALEGVPLVGITLAETGHELVIRFQVAAVPVTGFRHGRRKPSSKRFNYLASDFVLHVEDVVHLEIVFFREMLFCVIASNRCIETRQRGPTCWTLPCRLWRTPDRGTRGRVPFRGCS